MTNADHRYEKINNVCLVILAMIGVTTALIYMRAVLVPFVFALFFFSTTRPIVEILQQRLRFPRFVSIAVTFLIVLVFLTVLVLFISSSIEGFLQGADLYKRRILELIESSTQWMAKVGVKMDETSIRQEVASLPVFDWARDVTGEAFSFLGNVLLVLVFLLFLLAGDTQVNSKNAILDEMNVQIARYVAIKLFVSVITGVLVGVILGLMDVQLAFMFAVLTVLLNFIPNIGSIIATLLPLPIVILQFGLDWEFFVVLALTGVIQFTMGNLLEPKLTGESMELHPVAILLFLVFWGLVWGISGMFLAVPITAVLKIIFSRIETTKPIAGLLGGKVPDF